MSLIPKLIAASAVLAAVVPTFAQQPGSGGYFIHNGTVLSVPTPGYAMPGYQTPSGVIPSQEMLSGVAPAGANVPYQPNQNYGPTIPVAPPAQAPSAPLSNAPTWNGPMQPGYGVPPTAAPNGYPTGMPNPGPAYGQPFGYGTGPIEPGPANPRVGNYGPSNYGQPANGQAAIYYGSSQFRSDATPQTPNSGRGPKNARSDGRRTDPRDDAKSGQKMATQNRSPRFSTDPQPVDPNQQPQNGLQVDPQTGAIVRIDSPKDRMLTQEDKKAVEQQARANREAEAQKKANQQRLLAAQAAQQRQMQNEPADPRTLRFYGSLNGPPVSRLNETPTGSLDHGLNYHNQAKSNPRAVSTPEQSKGHYFNQTVSGMNQTNQTFFGINSRGLTPNAQGGTNMTPQATSQFRVNVK